MTKRILPLLLCFMMVGGCRVAWAANYPVPAGASTSTVQSTINTAAAASGGNTVTFAAGTYSLSQVTVPCPASPLVITGPATGYPASWSARPTAVINSSYTSEGLPIFSVSAPCSTGVTIEYLEVNGERPTSGGGAVSVGQGGYSNLTIEYNYFHGNQEIYPTAAGSPGYQYWAYDDPNANLIRLNGYQGGPTNSNITIEYNILGNPVAGDCNNVMTWIGGDLYNNPSNPSELGFSGYDATGGSCNGFGTYGNLTNVTVAYNVIQQQEQGMKFYEGGSGSNAFYLTNVNVDNNDIGFIHRCFIEGQQSPYSETFQNNDVHDPVSPAFGSWGFSLPQWDGGSLLYTNVLDNVMISNASSGGGPGTYEFWGLGDGNNNLIQGSWDAGFVTAANNGTHAGEVNNNVIQLPTGNYISNEGEPCCPNLPPASGNVESTTVGSIQSTAPTISPAPQSFSTSLTVTISDAGNTASSGPLGNTGIWYTLDGSTPAPKSGTSTYCSSPCNLTLTSTTTVKAIGMWGAVTQPASYPAGYGYTPSTVVSATYSGGGGPPTVATPVLSPGSETFTGTLSVSASTTTAGATLYCTTNGTTPTTASPLYTGPFSVVATTTIQCLATASGYNNSSIGSGTYTLSTANPTITSGYLGNSSNVNTLQVGASAIQFTAYANYSNGTTGTLPDTYGNTAVWSTSNTSILTVGSTGLVSCAAVGSANVMVKSSPGGIGFNPWTMSCTAPIPAPTLTSVSLATTGGISSFNVGQTNQILATCHYSDGSTTACNTADVHGNAVSMWTSSAASIVGISSSGLATGVAVGSANLSATVAGLSSANLALSVTSTHTLTGAYLSTPGSANTMTVGGTLQFSARCTYSDGTTQDCTVTDLYGDAVSGWASNNTPVMTIENVGAATPGLATAVAPGTAQAQATIDGSRVSNPWTVTVSATPVTLTGITLATTGGVTGIFVGQTNQIIATCLYSDGSTTTCNTTDSHGNVAGSYTSSSTGHATVNATTGLVTGVGAGTTNLTAQAGTFTSANLPLTVALVPSGTYTITISGNVRFTGRVSF